MKITDMDKDTLRDYMMRVTHEIGLPDKRFRFDSLSSTWKRAFRLARQNGYENVEMDCAKCIDTVHQWLIR